MPTPTMQEALRVAAIARQLRRAEMGDARSWREVRDSISEPSNQYASECARRLVERHVARARRWNRQLVIAQRAIRVGLFARRAGRPSFVPAGQAVRP